MGERVPVGMQGWRVAPLRWRQEGKDDHVWILANNSTFLAFRKLIFKNCRAFLMLSPLTNATPVTTPTCFKVANPFNPKFF